MLTITKKYADIPFAHRQPSHKGHCFFNHGHNWDVEITFTASELDENNFVIDFGKLDFIKDYFKKFDHSTVVANSDVEFLDMVTKYPQFFQIVTMEDVSCEGLAKQLFKDLNAIVKLHTSQRVWITRVKVFEDLKNSATFEV